MSKIKIFSLGGLNENGKNMYIVNVDENVFVFDAGLKFADDKLLGVDYIIPNYDYLKDNFDNIKGVFITHGHDEVMGALPDILKDLPNLPIYGTDFTIKMLNLELESEGIKANNIHVIKPHKKINFGSNSIFPISLSHEIPDTVGYVLNTPDGAIFYTGNFLFDPTMVGNYKTDIGKLAYIGKQGVLCLLSESIYASNKGFTSPNHRAYKVIRESINRNHGRILFNIFQTQIYRIQELFNEISKTDRNIVIMGKQLETIITSAINEGYVKFDKNRLMGIHHVNDKGIIVLISDDREKPFSNIDRIVRGYDKFIKLNDEDTVVFASPVYDGMERSATRLYDEIAKKGSNLIILPTKQYLGLHASSEDLMMMINLLNPKYYFPVIGEYRRQVDNAKSALKTGMSEENILLKLNGQVALFVDGNLTDTDEKVKVDDILIDGKTAGDIGDLVLKDRELLSENGIVIVSATIDKDTKSVIAGPEILTRGFIFVKDNIDLIKESEKISLDIINENIKNNYVDFNKIKSGIRDKLGKYFYNETECKPMILIVIQEV